MVQTRYRCIPPLSNNLNLPEIFTKACQLCGSFHFCPSPGVKRSAWSAVALCSSWTDSVAWAVRPSPALVRSRQRSRKWPPWPGLPSRCWLTAVWSGRKKKVSSGTPLYSCGWHRKVSINQVVHQLMSSQGFTCVWFCASSQLPCGTPGNILPSKEDASPKTEIISLKLFIWY